MMSKVGIIGGGPSGLMAAIEAAKNPNNKVVVLERNSSCCKKLLLTGNGRCNLTTILPINEMVESYYDKGKFLYSAFYQFSNYNLIDFFEKNGLKTKIEGTKVFPESDLANDVRKVLLKCAKDNSVKIKNNCLIKKIDYFLDHNKFLVDDSYFDYLVIATGGITYKATGSDGIGYRLAKSLNHSVVQPQPALGSMNTEIFDKLQGLALEVNQVSYFIDNELIASEKGSVLFTHFGLSGPPIINLSYYATGKGNHHYLVVSLFGRDNIRNKLDDLIKDNSAKQFNNILGLLLPKRLAHFLFDEALLSKQTAHVTKEEIKQVEKKLTYWKINIFGINDHDKSMATKGGVCLENINPKTMMSKIIKNLYFTGELIDIVGKTGGFNLQMAFSTGFVAGKSIKKGENDG